MPRQPIKFRPLCVAIEVVLIAYRNGWDYNRIMNRGATQGQGE